MGLMRKVCPELLLFATAGLDARNRRRVTRMLEESFRSKFLLALSEAAAQIKSSRRSQRRAWEPDSIGDAYADSMGRF